MLFVERRGCPQLLKDNQQKWTQPWVEYYIDKTCKKQPSDGHWRKDEIREPLIDDFHHNCGYCGVTTPTPMSYQEVLVEIEELKRKKEREFSSKGDVDHFLPKSKKPDLVYAWLNYVWSCKACNQVKGNFYDDEHPLINPCDSNDCKQIEYNEDTGFYQLKDEVKENDYWLKRWAHTQVKTTVNDSYISDTRKKNIMSLCRCFHSISGNLVILQDFEFADLRQQVKEDIVVIRQLIVNSGQHLLVQRYYQNLRVEYPQVAELIDQAD